MKKILLTALLALVLTGCGTSSPTTGNTTVAAEKAVPQVMNPNAPVLVEEFSDLQCPACGMISPQVTEIARKNPSVMKLVFYHFPLPQHNFAMIAAEGAECAADQGKFWEFTDMVYKNQENLNDDFVYAVAKNLNLDETKFKACVDSHEKRPIVQADFNEGQSRGIPGTPSFFINGQMVQYSGADTFEGYVKSLNK